MSSKGSAGGSKKKKKTKNRGGKSAYKGQRGGTSSKRSSTKRTYRGGNQRHHDYYSDDSYGSDDEDLFLSETVLNSVVCVYATHCSPNHSLPWSRNRQEHSTSTGFIIEGKYVLTNAHSVEHYTKVNLKKRGDDRKFVAKVLSVADDCDLALMTVEDEKFWIDLKPLPAGNLPRLQAPVTVVGYPVGGESICITAGVVSRVEMGPYSQGGISLLCMQIDAAINSGNSGGPALDDRERCVGVAFQSMDQAEAENVGYVIPWQTVQHFLDDYRRNSRFTGVCGIGFRWQSMESQYLQQKYQSQSGILIRKVNPTCDAFGKMQIGDVLTHFDGQSIGCDGTVVFRRPERIDFSYLARRKFLGESASLTLMRDGKEVKTDYKLPKIDSWRLSPFRDENIRPNYVVIAGLVFIHLSEPYLEEEYGSDWEVEAPVHLVQLNNSGMRKTANERVVILSQILSHDINDGYDDSEFSNTQLLRFNGHPITNLIQLNQQLEESKDQYLEFDLYGGETIVLNREDSKAATPMILEQNSIATACYFALQEEHPPLILPDDEKSNSSKNRNRSRSRSRSRSRTRSKTPNNSNSPAGSGRGNLP